MAAKGGSALAMYGQLLKHNEGPGMIDTLLDYIFPT